MKNILEQLKSLDEQQLGELNSAVIAELKRQRAAKVKAMKQSLSEGDRVRWVGKNGPGQGTVVAIKRKFAHVDVAGGTWRVPMNMLHKV